MATPRTLALSALAVIIASLVPRGLYADAMCLEAKGCWLTCPEGTTTVTTETLVQCLKGDVPQGPSITFADTGAWASFGSYSEGNKAGWWYTSMGKGKVEAVHYEGGVAQAGPLSKAAAVQSLQRALAERRPLDVLFLVSPLQRALVVAGFEALRSGISEEVFAAFGTVMAAVPPAYEAKSAAVEAFVGDDEHLRDALYGVLELALRLESTPLGTYETFQSITLEELLLLHGDVLTKLALGLHRTAYPSSLPWALAHATDVVVSPTSDGGATVSLGKPSGKNPRTFALDQVAGYWLPAPFAALWKMKPSSEPAKVASTWSKLTTDPSATVGRLEAAAITIEGFGKHGDLFGLLKKLDKIFAPPP